MQNKDSRIVIYMKKKTNDTYYVLFLVVQLQ